MAPQREDFGSWLEGTPGADLRSRVPNLGLPEAGPGSQARVLRRIAALLVDWFVCMAVASLFWPEPGRAGVFSAQPWATLAVFAGSTAVFVALLGHTLGHRLLGLRVARVVTDGDVRVAAPGAPGLLASAVRTGVLCLVLPAVVWDKDGRGLHDVAAKTVIVRR